MTYNDSPNFISTLHLWFMSIVSAQPEMIRVIIIDINMTAINQTIHVYLSFFIKIGWSLYVHGAVYYKTKIYCNKVLSNKYIPNEGTIQTRPNTARTL